MRPTKDQTLAILPGISTPTRLAFKERHLNLRIIGLAQRMTASQAYRWNQMVNHEDQSFPRFWPVGQLALNFRPIDDTGEPWPCPDRISHAEKQPNQQANAEGQDI